MGKLFNWALRENDLFSFVEGFSLHLHSLMEWFGSLSRSPEDVALKHIQYSTFPLPFLELRFFFDHEALIRASHTVSRRIYWMLYEKISRGGHLKFIFGRFVDFCVERFGFFCGFILNIKCPPPFNTKMFLQTFSLIFLSRFRVFALKKNAKDAKKK